MNDNFFDERCSSTLIKRVDKPNVVHIGCESGKQSKRSLRSVVASTGGYETGSLSHKLYQHGQIGNIFSLNRPPNINGKTIDDLSFIRKSHEYFCESEKTSSTSVDAVTPKVNNVVNKRAEIGNKDSLAEAFERQEKEAEKKIEKKHRREFMGRSVDSMIVWGQLELIVFMCSSREVQVAKGKEVGCDGIEVKQAAKEESVENLEQPESLIPPKEHIVLVVSKIRELGEDILPVVELTKKLQSKGLKSNDIHTVLKYLRIDGGLRLLESSLEDKAGGPGRPKGPSCEVLWGESAHFPSNNYFNVSV